MFQETNFKGGENQSSCMKQINLKTIIIAMHLTSITTLVQ